MKRKNGLAKLATPQELPARVDEVSLLRLQLAKARAENAQLIAALEEARFALRFGLSAADHIEDDMTITRGKNAKPSPPLSSEAAPPQPKP